MEDFFRVTRIGWLLMRMTVIQLTGSQIKNLSRQPFSGRQFRLWSASWANTTAATSGKFWARSTASV